MYKMPIFTAEDEQRIRIIHEQRAAEDKKLFFEYFGDKALEHITEMITLNKESYLQKFEQHARSYVNRNVRSIPILTFNTVEQLNQKATSTRKTLQRYYCQFEQSGSYYTSLSGIHVVDLRAIYTHSNFRLKINERLGNTFSISMKSNILYTSDDVRIYENVLYLNAHI